MMQPFGRPRVRYTSGVNVPVRAPAVAWRPSARVTVVPSRSLAWSITASIFLSTRTPSGAFGIRKTWMSMDVFVAFSALTLPSERRVDAGVRVSTLSISCRRLGTDVIGNSRETDALQMCVEPFSLLLHWLKASDRLNANLCQLVWWILTYFITLNVLLFIV